MKKLDYKKFCLIIISLSLVSIQVIAQNGWTQKADIPYGGGSASVVNGKIYCVGGTTAGSLIDQAYNLVYDPSTDTWNTALAPMPTARGFLTSEVVRDTIYAIGGGYPTAKKKVEAYDPITNSWTTKADMLSPRLGMRAGVVDGIIYTIGGNYNQRNCQAYDPSTNTWTEKTPIPVGGGGSLSVTVYNGLIYAFGGSTYTPWGALSTVYAYNPQADTWTPKQNMPTARFAFRTYLVNGKIYAIGGTQSENGVSLTTVEVYDPITDTWETKPDMPFGMAWFSGAVVNDKIYVISGTQNWGTTISHAVWEYDPIFHTDIPAGNVSGTWTAANSPYHVLGEITVPNGETLTIDPGVEVVFMGHYKFNIQGRLLAIGTQQDPIHFTAENTGTGWHGVRFTDTPNTNDTSKIVYCSFKYGKANTGTNFDRCGGAIFIKQFDKVLISKSLFDSNMNSGTAVPQAGPAIYVYDASVTIEKSTFSNNSGSLGTAIACVGNSNSIISHNVLYQNNGLGGSIAAYGSGSSPLISGNIIFDNISYYGAGINAEVGSTPRIENNIIFHNQAAFGPGIFCWSNVKPIIINNTIVDNIASSNGGGIFCTEASNPILINNIIYGNSATTGEQVFIDDNLSDPNFLNCDIQGGIVGFAGSGSGSNYTGIYENNIDADPLFLPSVSDNFLLSNNSPCIGAGIDSIEIVDVWYKAPPFCINGNPRPSPAGTNPDIGACENTLGSPTPVELTSFTAEALDQKVVLKWKTATELNNNGFEIQRRIDESEFATIGFVRGEGTTTNQKEYSYVDKELADGKYFYRLKQFDFNGSYEYSNEIEVDVRSLNEFALEQNYPNPFNPTTTIGYVFKEKTNAKIILLNAIGEEVDVLVNEEQEKGFHKVDFNAVNLPSGVYFYRLQTGSFVQTKKMLLLK